MRRAFLTTSILTAILLSACTEGPKTDLETLSTTELSTTEVIPKETSRVKTKATSSSKAKIESYNDTALPEEYQGLDPKHISRAEIDELIALGEEQGQFTQAFQKEREVG